MMEVKSANCEKLPEENLATLIECLIDQIDNQKPAITNKELINLSRNYVERLTEADPHIYHEIAETALNLLIKRKYAKCRLAETDPIEFVAKILKPMAARLPTQTWRSREQGARQQFSTPPAIAFCLSFMVSERTGETVFEPSAGTGSLIVWRAMNAAENRTHVNEISARRREMLRLLGFSPTAYNAEFIDDYLPAEIRPNCLLMNPPFSANGERTERNSSKYGFRHVESALRRLEPGGRFGIVLGEAAGLDAKTGEDFWGRLTGAIGVKAIIKINGREYYKNGTTVDINLIVGEKLLAERKSDPRAALREIISVSAKTVEEALEKSENLNLRLS